LNSASVDYHRAANIESTEPSSSLLAPYLSISRGHTRPGSSNASLQIQTGLPSRSAAHPVKTDP